MEGAHGQGNCPSSAAVLVFRTRMSAPPASFLYIVVALQDRSSSSPAPIPIDESGLAGVGGGPPGQDFIDDGASKLLALCHGTGLMTSSSLLMSGVLVHTLFAASCSQWDWTGRLTSKDAERRSPPILRASIRSTIALTFRPPPKCAVIQSLIQAVTLSRGGCSPPVMSEYSHLTRDQKPRTFRAFRAKGEPLYQGEIIHGRLSMVDH